MIKIGKYEVCILDILTEEAKDGMRKLSSHQVWQHIGFSAITYQFLNTTLTVELLVGYGLIVAGSKVANTWLKLKYGVNNAIIDDTSAK